MDDTEFDTVLTDAAFALAAERGWRAASPAAAARHAGLPLDRARARFSNRHAILLHLGRIADQAALADITEEGSVRDRLFDLLMRRIDVFQTRRAGVLALLRALPTEPATAALLTCATERSMAWMLEAAGVSATGLRGALRVRGLLAVWLWTMRAWQTDESPDLTVTMAALDSALARAEPFAKWLNGQPAPNDQPTPTDQPTTAAET